MMVLDIFGGAFVGLLNMGLVLGAIMGAILLLRPVTNRLLAPRQRVALWGAGWVLGFAAFMAYVARLPLPFPTFPDLLISRAENGCAHDPAPLAQEGGDYFLALPGGSAVPFYPARVGGVRPRVRGAPVFCRRPWRCASGRTSGSGGCAGRGSPWTRRATTGWGRSGIRT